MNKVLSYIDSNSTITIICANSLHDRIGITGAVFNTAVLYRDRKT